MKKILLGTGNKHKIIEITKILKDIDNDIEIILMDDLQDAPEKEFSFNQNAYLKALYYHNCYNLPVITDDSGICAVALNNRPGVLSKRYSGTGLDEDNNNKLIEDLKDKEDKRGFYRCSICLLVNKDEFYLFEGRFDGLIIDKPVGTNGFGYDPIFFLKEYNKTVAELDLETKNKMSHRAIALNKMSDYLKKNDIWKDK